MGCYLCQNDYDNVHTCAYICTLQYACQYAYARYNMHVNMHMHVTICMSTCICTIQYACQHAYARYNMHACQHSYAHYNMHIIIIHIYSIMLHAWDVNNYTSGSIIIHLHPIICIYMSI